MSVPVNPRVVASMYAVGATGPTRGVTRDRLPAEVLASFDELLRAGVLREASRPGEYYLHEPESNREAGGIAVKSVSVWLLLIFGPVAIIRISTC